MKGCIYISGPVTGTDDYVERFAKAEKHLAKRGYSVLNPVKATAHLPADTDWETYMGHALRMLCTADAIYMLKGWEDSRGAKIEYMYARLLELTVIEEEDLVEVVRCRDCKWNGGMLCDHKFGLVVVNDDSYCSFGERREDGEIH